MRKEKMLNLKIEDCDLGGTITIKEFLRKLLQALWEDGEGFSGKRPFGNSGWEYDLYKPLIKAGVIGGELDEEGYIDEVDIVAAQKAISELIDECFSS